MAAILIFAFIIATKVRFIQDNKYMELREAKVEEVEASVYRSRAESYSALLSYEVNGETKFVKTDFCFQNKRILDKGTVYIKGNTPV